jgi:hypothetical protein
MVPRVTSHLDREAAYFRALAGQCREIADAQDRGEYGTSPQTHSLRMTLEASIRVNETLAGWADWTRSRPA